MVAPVSGSTELASNDASGSRQLSVLAVCFLMKLDGIVRGTWMVITTVKFSSWYTLTNSVNPETGITTL